MIRINLLSEGRRPVVARRARATLGDQDPSFLMLVGGLVLGLLIAGSLWWIQRGKIVEIDGRIERAQREVDELAEIIQEVEDFKAKKVDLETKIAVIQDLKRKQKGPVRVMDDISRALPDLLWLEAMTMDGQHVTLRGRALNTAAIATFIGNLHEVPEFNEPDTKDVRADQRGDVEVFQFNIVFDFVQRIEEDEDGDGVADAAAEGVGP